MAKKKKGHVESGERQLPCNLRELTSREFVYEDLWCGMVPFDGKLSELQTDPPVSFAELSWREQADTLREFIQWGRYPERDWNDEYRISENIAAGRPAEQWLEGTSLHQSFALLAEGKTPPPPKKCPEITQQDLANILNAVGTAAPDQAPAKTDGTKISLCDLRDRSPKQAKGEERHREVGVAMTVEECFDDAQSTEPLHSDVVRWLRPTEKVPR